MLLTKENIKALPPLYSQENNKDPLAVIKFFDPTGSYTWYAIEGEKQPDGDYLFFGLVDGFEMELGYFTLNDLLTCKKGLRGMRALPIERDRHFDPTPISKIREKSHAY